MNSNRDISIMSCAGLPRYDKIYWLAAGEVAAPCT